MLDTNTKQYYYIEKTKKYKFALQKEIRKWIRK